MANLSAVYSLGAILFNNGIFGHGSNDDLYWIDTVRGLDGPTLRVPVEDVPFGHGGVVHRSWKGPRHPAFEGRLIVQSASGTACEEVLDDMEEALAAALAATLAPASGTLSWTKRNGNSYTLAVHYEVPLDVQPADNYRTRTFNFGLVSAAADPS